MANQLRASGLSTYTQVASGRSAAVESRTSESRVAAVTCTRGSSLQLCPCPLLLSDQVKCCVPIV